MGGGLASSFNLKNKRKFKVTNASETLKKVFKKLLMIILLAVVPVFFVILLIVAVILAIWHDIFGAQAVSSMAINHYFHFATNNASNSYGGLMDDVVKAMEKILYLIFIKPILWVLNQVTSVIFFIGSGSVNKQIFKGGVSLANLPKMYLIALAVAIGLIGVLLGVKLIMVMGERFDQKGVTVRRAFQNMIFVVASVLLMPVVFFLINNLTDIITGYINQSMNNKNNLGLFIFNSSFDNGKQNFTSVPDSWSFHDSSHFNYIVCLFAECFMIYVMILVALNLFIRIFELFMLFCISPIVLVSTVADVDGNLKHFKNWSEITIQKFILFSFIFLAFNIFLTSLNIFTSIATAIPSEPTRPVFVLLGIFGASIVVIKAPQILNSIVGGQASLMDSLSHLSGLKTATSALSTSAMMTGGMVAGASKLSKKGLFGFNKTTRNADGSFSTKKVMPLKSGAKGVAKGVMAGVAGVATTVGVVSHPVHNIKRTGKGLASGSKKATNYSKEGLSNLTKKMTGHWSKYYQKGKGKK